MISRWIILKMKSVSDNIVEIIRTHISNSTAFSESRAVFWDNMEKYDGAKQASHANIIRYMRLAYWITKATHTHTHTHTHTQSNGFRERTSVLRYTYIACLVKLSFTLDVVSTIACNNPDTPLEIIKN
jgi:hypothetical protein